MPFSFQNHKIEVVRWLVRLCMDRNLISDRQFLFSAKGLEECGRMVGGWARLPKYRQKFGILNQ